MIPKRKSRDIFDRGCFHQDDLNTYLSGKTIKSITFPQDKPDMKPFEVRVEFEDNSSISVYGEGEGGFAGTIDFKIYKEEDFSKWAKPISTAGLYDEFPAVKLPENDEEQ